MFDSVRPHRQQPTRLPCPWDSPGKNTGLGCHVLLQCMKVKSESEVAQSCLTLSHPMDCSPPGSSIHGIFPGKSTGVGCQCFLHRLPETRLKQCPVHSLLLCCSKRVFAVTSVFSWQKCISLCPASFYTPGPNFPVTPDIP